MAKKHFGKIITFAAIAGAAAAAISYVLQYKSFHKELDEDFHDFEDDFEEFEEANGNDSTRSYVSLNPEHQTEKTDEDTAGPIAEEEPESSIKADEDVKEETETLTDSSQSLASPETAVPVFDNTVNISTTIVEEIIE